MTEESKFGLPKVHVNYGGWGPTELPSQFVNIPYASFGKNDKLGKVADFSASAQRYAAQNRYRYSNQNNEHSGVNSEFQYRHDADEEESFQLVDNASSVNNNKKMTRLRPTYNARLAGQARYAAKQRRQPLTDNTVRVKGQQVLNKRWDRLNSARRAASGGRRWNDDDNKVDRMASVQIKSDWEVVEQFDLTQLTKLQANIPPVSDVKWCGEVSAYDELYDRISTRTEQKLQRYDNREFFYVTTTDDPVIEELATQNEASVFATDAILAHLMACTRSVYPWDLVVQRVNNLIFLDKRDASQFDFLTVNETATDTPSTDDANSINHPTKLSMEATMINQNFSQQILKKNVGTKKFESKNPFTDDDSENCGAFAYRYRKWQLNEGINLIARCELHGITQKRGQDQYFNAYALNEWDSKVSSGGIDWRKKVDSQRGAVLANELKNNSFKLSKWTAQSILSGADQMKLGYVSRASRSDPYSHVVLGTQGYRPREFAQQIGLNINTMWGIIKMLVELFRDQPEGKYVVMKDPNAATVRVYSVPIHTFEEESEEESEEDSEGDEGSEVDDE